LVSRAGLAGGRAQSKDSALTPASWVNAGWYDGGNFTQHRPRHHYATVALRLRGVRLSNPGHAPGAAAGGAYAGIPRLIPVAHAASPT